MSTIQEESKIVNFTIVDVYIKEMLQMDKNKHHGDLTKYVFQTGQIDQKIFEAICGSQNYRINLQIALKLKPEIAKIVEEQIEQETNKGKRSA